MTTTAGPKSKSKPGSAGIQASNSSSSSWPSQNHPRQYSNQDQAQSARSKGNRWATGNGPSSGNQTPRSFSNVVGNANKQQPSTQQSARPQPQPQTARVPFNPNSNTSSPSATQQTQQVRLDPASTHHLHDRFIYLLGVLIGTQVTVTTKNGIKFTGVFTGATTEGEFGVVLKHAVKEMPSDGGVKSEIQPSSLPISTLIILSKDLVDVFAVNVDINGLDPNAPNRDSFRTDAEISGQQNDSSERELTRWAPDDSETFGNSLTLDSSSKGTWDQFAVNEKLFGTKTDYHEELYTTRINKDRPDYIELEKKAAQIAREIEGTSTTNIHVQEERGQAIEDNGVDEEDKYGAVIRGPNAYTPPALRKQSEIKSDSGQDTAKPISPVATTPQLQPISSSQTSQEPATVLTSTSKPTSIAPSDNKSSAASIGSGTSEATSAVEPAIVSTFRQWVGDEKQKFMVKKQALAKKEKDGRLADLLKFSQNFKLNTPVPQDLVPILTKDKEKQQEIVSKSNAVAATVKPGGKAVETTSSTSLHVSNSKQNATVKLPLSSTQPATSVTSASGTSTSSVTKEKPQTPTTSSLSGSSSFKFNVKASSFKPNPNATAFAPSPSISTTSSTDRKGGGNTMANSGSPAISTGPIHPFFGNGFLRKTDASLRDFFDPIRRTRHLSNPKAVPPTWPFGTKPYRHQYQYNPVVTMGQYSNEEEANAAMAQAHAQQQAAVAAVSMTHPGVNPGHQYAIPYAYGSPYGPRGVGFQNNAGGAYPMGPIPINQAGIPYMNPGFVQGIPFTSPFAPGAPPAMIYTTGHVPRPPPGATNVTTMPYYSMMPAGSPVPTPAGMIAGRPVMMMGGVNGVAAPSVVSTTATSSPIVQGVPQSESPAPPLISGIVVDPAVTGMALTSPTTATMVVPPTTGEGS